MGFVLWEEGSGKQDLRVVGRGRLSFSGVNVGVTLKGLRRVDNAVVAVEESCVLDVKSVWNTADYFFRSCSCI